MSCRLYPIDRTDRIDKTPAPEMPMALRPDLTRVAPDSEGGATISGKGTHCGRCLNCRNGFPWMCMERRRATWRTSQGRRRCPVVEESLQEGA